MSKETPNAEQRYLDSIRLGGKKIEDLPIAESAIAQQQLPDVIEDFKKQEIKTIRDSYPTQSVAYINSAIKEAEANIVTVTEMKGREQALISEYTSIISLCQFRDKQIAKLDENSEEYDKEVKELNKEFPPYNVAALQQQVTQSIESTERCDSVIAQEYSSIAELKEHLGKCLERDNKLRSLGVAVD